MLVSSSQRGAPTAQPTFGALPSQAGPARSSSASSARSTPLKLRRATTLAWGIGFVGEALVRLVLVYELPVSTMVVVSPILLAALVVVLVNFSRVYGQRVGWAFRGEGSARA